MKVRDVMSRAVVSVTPDTSLKVVARMMAEHGISGLPVVDVDGAVLGVVSEADFVRKERDGMPPAPRWITWLVGEDAHVREERAKVAATTAGQAMSAPPITIGPARSVRVAATIMAERNVNRLPVVDEGRLVGIVTRADLVRAFLRPDEEIERAVRRDVMRDTLWIDAEALDVQVADGVVHLAGRIDRRSTGEILRRLVGEIDGVIGVDSTMTWDLDDRDIEPATLVEPEPGAASLAAREPHRPA